MSNLKLRPEEPGWLAPAKSIGGKAAPAIADVINDAIDNAVDKFMDFLNGGNQDGDKFID